MNVVLRVESVAKHFGDRDVLTAATLRAEAGRMVALVGRNGSGKSTLLRIAAGDLAADNGLVFWQGAALGRPRWADLAARGLWYLPDREMLAPDWSVEAHLACVTRRFGAAAVAEILERLELGPLLREKCRSLSTGERRRAELAMALVRQPACLLADEPLRNLDPKDRIIVAASLRQLADAGCAVVATGHELEELLAPADSVTWCTDGTTYELGAPAVAREDWRFRAQYLPPLLQSPPTP